MISLVDGHQSILQRVQSLGASATPQWGKLTLAQMLAHCHKPLQVATGKLELKRGLMGKLLGGWAKKKFVVSDAPFGRNGPTDPKFLDASAVDVEAERATLIDLIQEYVKGGPKCSVHPFFGPMDERDWDRLMWKHLDHHLRQFGV